ncbi:LysM peptidoglycan-binding domain-containing protein [Paenibacillus taichungensis]|uniref:LysM peptidoglycan-binding domain-containing protein n=1 Tax=Paenibacillus taichungensis TaxID=484184 RepID=A0ABX2MH06_9BACL|nr:LysM peptidoglycan-binding domain-containing protein [Paenibacillus taichungensis]NUU53009.1 LysM peptidoglycan-binding domain-containing protein [Paenibacillus taichungensis]
MKKKALKYVAITMIKLIETVELLVKIFSRKARRSSRLITSITYVCITIFGSAALFNQTMDTHSTDEYITYIVESGDTLFNISKKYYNGDPRKAVDLIQSTNNIQSNIQPGQILLVPIKK